jgi:ComF family protein
MGPGLNLAGTTAKALAACRSLLTEFLRFALPWACAGCRTPLETAHDSGFCPHCYLKIPRIDGLVCRYCGLPLPEGGRSCFTCRTEPPRILIRAATEYSGPVRPAVHRYKYAGRKSLTGTFTGLLESAWIRYPELEPVDAIVAVPIHRRTLRERGFNQAGLLADALSMRLDVPYLKDVLLRTRRTRPQFSLGRNARRTNVSDAFGFIGMAGSLKRLNVLLIDDVSTTAATLCECAKALQIGRPKSIKALVLARDL